MVAKAGAMAGAEARVTSSMDDEPPSQEESGFPFPRPHHQDLCEGIRWWEDDKLWPWGVQKVMFGLLWQRNDGGKETDGSEL